MARRYDDPEAFRQALQARLRNAAAERKLGVQDLQLKFLIERLIARLFNDPSPPWVLKGGFAMELRYRPKARTTRDVDLTVGAASGTSSADRFEAVRELIQEAAAIDLGDHLVFRIGASRGELPGAPLGGGRFPVEALLAGRTFGRFHVDVGIGDPLGGKPEELVGDDLLAFAGIPPARALAVPKPQQFAEKLHAYTFPWTDRENTRSKDLIDMVLLIERGDLDRAEVDAAIRETFSRRGTHPMPEQIGPPPASWEAEYQAMAMQTGLAADDLSEAYTVVCSFLTESAP